MDNIYTVESGSLQMVSKPIPDLGVGFVWAHKSVSLFGRIIPCDTMRTLYLYVGCL